MRSFSFQLTPKEWSALANVTKDGRDRNYGVCLFPRVGPPSVHIKVTDSHMLVERRVDVDGEPFELEIPHGVVDLLRDVAPHFSSAIFNEGDPVTDPAGTLYTVILFHKKGPTVQVRVSKSDVGDTLNMLRDFDLFKGVEPEAVSRIGFSAELAKKIAAFGGAIGITETYGATKGVAFQVLSTPWSGVWMPISMPKRPEFNGVAEATPVATSEESETPATNGVPVLEESETPIEAPEPEPVAV